MFMIASVHDVVTFNGQKMSSDEFINAMWFFSFFLSLDFLVKTSKCFFIVLCLPNAPKYIFFSLRKLEIFIKSCIALHISASNCNDSINYSLRIISEKMLQLINIKPQYKPSEIFYCLRFWKRFVFALHTIPFWTQSQRCNY